MRIRPLLPILLATTAVMPAVAGDYRLCINASDFVSCLIEQDEFARQRNAEIDASIARVEHARQGALIASMTHCTTRYSRAPRCLAEREQRFADHQNALAVASVTRVATVRAFEAARNAEAAASIARVAAQRARRLAKQQNALVEASLAAVRIERERRFAAYQNELAAASVERVEAERRRELAARLSPCTSPADTRPRCLAQQAREFAAQQNALAIASAKRVKAERARIFAAARNAEIEASIAAVAAVRTQNLASTTSHCARNPATPRCEAERGRSMQASLTHCKSATDTSPRCEAERERDFRIARNGEIDRSIAAVATARANGLAAHTSSRHDGNAFETGAIGAPSLPQMRTRGEPSSILRRDISADPCRVMPLQPVQFTRGARIETDMKPELDRLAKLARSCPGMRIEVHGYADGISHFSNGHLSRARAQALADYLIAAGVAANRVTAIASSGRNSPSAHGFTPAYGDRAEFVVKDPSTDAAARRVMWDLAELLDPKYIPAVANLSP